MKKLIAYSLVLSTALYAGWQDQLGSVLESATKITQNSSTSNTANLSNTDMTSALKEALTSGVKYAVNDLGQSGGYLNNPLVKIAVPESMQSAAKVLKSVGGEKYVDNFVSAMNKAAEEAAPKTAEVFVDTIKNMSIDDAKGILAGNDDAATQYFKTNSSSKLADVIKPIVTKSMADNDVAKYYDSFQSFYKSNAGALENDTVKSLAGQFGMGGYLPSSSDEDLDSYVTNKSIDGLMTMIAQKEKEIRDNPLMQNSDLLKKVFSAF